MPEAIHTHTTGCVIAPSRRQFGGATLAALCGAAFAGAVVLPDRGEGFPSAASPDAELIRLCAECDALQGQVDALWRDRMTHLPTAEQIAIEHVRDAAQQPILAQLDTLLDRVCELQPATLQGHLVRVRTYARWHKDLPGRDSEHRDEALQGAVLRDLAALAELVA